MDKFDFLALAILIGGAALIFAWWQFARALMAVWRIL